MEESIISAIYGRVSDEESAEKENGSLEQQKHLCLELAKAKSITTGKKHIIKNILVEEDAISGGTDQRPKYQELIKLIKQRQVGAVFAKSVSRLSRSTLHFCEFMDLCFENGVALYIQEIDIDPNSAMGAALFKLLAVVAELEREQIRSRTRSSIRSRMKNNRKINGGNVVLGFDKDSNASGVWHPNKEELKHVEFLMTTFNKTLSYIETCRAANTRGIKTKTGKEFRKQDLKRILTNIKYIGKLSIPTCTVDRKKYPKVEIAPNYTPPITVDLPFGEVIARDLFESVQRSIELVEKRSTPRRGNRIFPFSNILKHEDGSDFTGFSGTARSGNLHYYYRNNKNKVHLKANALEEAVFGGLKRIYENDEELGAHVKAILANKTNKLDVIKGQLRKIDNELKELEVKEEALGDKLSSFSGANLKILNWLEKNLATIEKAKEEKLEIRQALDHEHRTLSEKTLTAKSLREILKVLFENIVKAPLEAQRGLIRQVCDKIVYLGDGQVQVVWSLDIIPAGKCVSGGRELYLGFEWGG